MLLRVLFSLSQQTAASYNDGYSVTLFSAQTAASCNSGYSVTLFFFKISFHVSVASFLPFMAISFSGSVTNLESFQSTPDSTDWFL